METDLEINSLEFKIKTIKENIISNKLNENNKYINNKEKIYEDTKGSNKTLSTDKHDKRNSNNGVNKITFNKNEIKRPSNYFAKKYLYKDALMQGNYYRNKLFDLFLKNNELNNNKNQINNFLNINVNINLGFNKNDLSSSSIDKEEDNTKSKDDKVNIIFVENDSITESSIQNEENKE